MIHGDQKDSDILQRYVGSLIDNIDSIGFSFEQVNLVQRTYLDLIRRIKCNLIGIIIQLREWPNTPELRIPVSLLFRTCLTDALTGLYLAGFQEHEDSFRNELEMLDVSYLRYLRFVAENLELERPGSTEAEITKEADELLQEMHSRAQHMFVPGTTDLKKPEQLRDSSDIGLFKDPKAIKRQLTESDMFHQVNAMGTVKHLAYLHRLQRDFSQQHHYCPANRDNINFPDSYYCAAWFKCLLFTQEIVGLLATLLGTDDALLKPIKAKQGELIDFLTERDTE